MKRHHHKEMILFSLVNHIDWAMWLDFNTLSLYVIHFLKHLSEIFKMVC